MSFSPLRDYSREELRNFQRAVAAAESFESLPSRYKIAIVEAEQNRQRAIREQNGGR